MSESVNEFKSFYDMVKKWTVRDFRTQKIKAEVIVDMLISDYIKDIVSQNLGNDIKDIKLIAKEFPIARIGQTPNEKEGNRQYASVDFLMSGKENDKSVIYLVELKTSANSLDGLQLWNMLWTCYQESDSLYNRFQDVILNYGIDKNGNNLSTKKYQYTLSRYAQDHELKECESGIQHFGKKRPQKIRTESQRIKKEQTMVAEDILNNMKKTFTNAKLQIVYVYIRPTDDNGKKVEINFTDMAIKGYKERVIQNKIADKDNNDLKKYFTEQVKIKIDGKPSPDEVSADISSFIAKQDIKKISLTDVKLSEKKANEWEKIRNILIELQKPWGEWFLDDFRNIVMERTGLTSEADVSAAVKAMRNEGE